MTKSTFSEKQRFNQWWLYLLLGTVLLYALIPAFKQFQEGVLFTKELTDKDNMLVVIAILLVVNGFIFLVHLKTHIDHSGIKMNFFPLKSKFVVWENIKSISVVNYGFVGGWGIRLWTKFGTVYNVKGKIGLSIKLVNGDQFLIGTQKPEELKGFLKQEKQIRKKYIA